MARAVGPCRVDAATVAARRDRIHERIEAAGGDPEAVRLVAVTKGFTSEVIGIARRAGLEDLGESYAQELAAKAAAGADGPGADAMAGAEAPRWHFIGRLQRNKVRRVAGLVSCWHSVDRRELGAEIAKRSPGAGVMVQVDISAEPAKGGCAPGETGGLVADLAAEGLAVEGLMGIASDGGGERAAAQFRTLAGLADRLGLAERSMGMSGDLAEAVSAGATMLRVGTALFGERPDDGA